MRLGYFLTSIPNTNRTAAIINTGVSIYMILKHKTEHFLLRNFKPFNLQRKRFLQLPCHKRQKRLVGFFVLTLFKLIHHQKLASKNKKILRLNTFLEKAFSWFPLHKQRGTKNRKAVLCHRIYQRYGK